MAGKITSVFRLERARLMKTRFIPAPKLAGYSFTAEQAHTARDNGRLLSMRLETSMCCNLGCLYCNGTAGKKRKNEIPVSLMRNVILQARALGARSVVIIGGGEPTLFEHFRLLVHFINRQGMIPVVITNATLLTKKMAYFLYQENASVIFKLDSLRPAVQDFLAGKIGTHARIRQGIEHLLDAGFNKGSRRTLRLGASFVLTRQNLKEIPAIWEYCRKNNIYPNLEEFIPRSRGFINQGTLSVPRAKVRALKQKLLAYDQTHFGYDWLVYAPLPGHGCLQTLYSIYLTCTGEIRPCADIEVANLRAQDMNLEEIIRTPFFQKARYPEKYIQGKCRICEYSFFCTGCRGLAYCQGIEEGLSPEEAICRQDPLCWK